MDHEPTEYHCSFCNKHQAEVGRLFAGPGGVFICDECVHLSAEIVTEARKADERTTKRPWAPLRLWRPKGGGR